MTISPQAKNIWLLSAGALSILIYSFLVHESHRIPNLFHFLISYISAFFLFIVSAFIFWKNPPSEKRSTLLIILSFSVLFRLISLKGEPLFEDDMHRYLWDGKVASHGINPYLYPPSDFQLMHLRDSNWEGINYKDVPTIYPPLSQFIFRVFAEIAPNSTFALKSIFVLFDLGVITCLIFMLKFLNLPLSRVILYAWNPLVIKEFSNSGHLDVAAIFFVMLGCVFLMKGLKTFSAVSLGLAILVKIYPLILLPALIRHFRLKHFAIVGVVIILGYIPFVGAQELLFDGLGTYARYWEFNDSGYVLLTGILKFLTKSPDLIAKSLIIMGLLGFGLSQSRQAAHNDSSMLKVFFYIIGLLLIFSPTVDTWYITWIIPFLCFVPAKSWLILSGSCVFAYLFYWKNQDLWWIRVIEYAPFYLCFIVEAVYLKRKYFLRPREEYKLV
jgi:alpha-1,6-mannosyltransferase